MSCNGILLKCVWTHFSLFCCLLQECPSQLQSLQGMLPSSSKKWITRILFSNWSGHLFLFLVIFLPFCHCSWHPLPLPLFLTIVCPNPIVPLFITIVQSWMRHSLNLIYTKKAKIRNIVEVDILLNWKANNLDMYDIVYDAKNRLNLQLVKCSIIHTNIHTYYIILVEGVRKSPS
jgi:hypothetical protein